jgi:hypothetical protein
MRYLIHLLPEAIQCRAFDELRARIGVAIGHNRALDYPTAHVTLVWAIQDMPGDEEPIDGAALAGLLDLHRGTGTIPLTVRAGERIEHHVLLPLNDTPALAALRQHLYDGARAVAAGPAGRATARAERVRQQDWPHLTLAQEVEADRWQRATEMLAAAGGWVYELIIGAELALLARDIEAGQPYQIVHRVPL